MLHRSCLLRGFIMKSYYIDVQHIHFLVSSFINRIGVIYEHLPSGSILPQKEIDPVGYNPPLKFIWGLHGLGSYCTSAILRDVQHPL